MNGVVTSLIDMYFNLSHYYSDIEFNITYNNAHSVNNFIYYKIDYPYINFTPLNKKTDFDILIVSPDFIGQHNTTFKKFKYNKLIILDSCKLYIDYCRNNNFTANKINEIPLYYMLGNKFNKKFITNKENYYIYYHKFSKERLDFLENKYKNEEDILTRRFETDEKYFSLLHRFSCYNYQRYHIYNKKDYIENIGKLIFEYRYLNKPVYYSAKTKTMNDGLTEYLSLFNINDNMSQEIKITKHDIEDKLFMKSDDFILKIIEK